jgi:DNA polymerase-3 subunit delta
MPAEKRRAAGLHLVIGSDSLLGERALQALLQRELGEGASADAVQLLRGEETSWARVLDAARTRSLFAERRAVVVRAAEATKGSEEDLLRYLADPNPDVLLVLIAAKADKRRTLWKRLIEVAELHPAEPLKGRALRGFVLDELKRRRLSLSDDGLDELIERVGQDLRRLIGELDKLQSFVGPSGRLTADDVASVLGRGVARPFYRLGDLLWARRGLELLEFVQELLDDGESGVLLLGVLHRSLRQVQLARALAGQRGGRETLVARTRIQPFKAGDLMEAARRYSEADLQRASRALGEADRRLKTGVDASAALAAAVIEGFGPWGGPKLRRPAR